MTAEEIALPFQPTRIRWRQSALIKAAKGKETARILAFHGGGGVDGNPEMLAPFCETLAAGHDDLTIILAQYRTLNRDGATLAQMLSDAGHALRWSRRKAASGSRLFVMGASFGGLLALDAVMASPNRVKGLILLNPVTDIARGGFSNRVIPSDGRPDLSPLTRWAGWQGMQHLNCLTIHGCDDNVVPVGTSEEFSALWPERHSRFIAYPNAGHGFFNLPAHQSPVARNIHDFLALAPGAL